MAQEVDDEMLRRLVAEGLSQREIARQTGIPRSTLQDRLKQLEAYPVYRGSTTVMPRGGPTDELGDISDDIRELVRWWRSRKFLRAAPSSARETQRWTVHVDRQWIERVKDMAEVEGVSQAEIVDRAFRAFFAG